MGVSSCCDLPLKMLFPDGALSSRSGMATVYVRYKQVEALTSEGGAAFRRLNSLGLVLGLVSSLGMCVVANFQVRTASPGSG